MAWQRYPYDKNAPYIGNDDDTSSTLPDSAHVGETAIKPSAGEVYFKTDTGWVKFGGE
jgi:hypothetical protein